MNTKNPRTWQGAAVGFPGTYEKKNLKVHKHTTEGRVQQQPRRLLRIVKANADGEWRLGRTRHASKLTSQRWRVSASASANRTGIECLSAIQVHCNGFFKSAPSLVSPIPELREAIGPLLQGPATGSDERVNHRTPGVWCLRPQAREHGAWSGGPRTCLGSEP